MKAVCEWGGSEGGSNGRQTERQMDSVWWYGGGRHSFDAGLCDEMEPFTDEEIAGRSYSFPAFVYAFLGDSHIQRIILLGGCF